MISEQRIQEIIDSTGSSGPGAGLTSGEVSELAELYRDVKSGRYRTRIVNVIAGLLDDSMLQTAASAVRGML